MPSPFIISLPPPPPPPPPQNSLTHGHPCMAAGRRLEDIVLLKFLNRTWCPLKQLSSSSPNATWVPTTTVVLYCSLIKKNGVMIIEIALWACLHAKLIVVVMALFNSRQPRGKTTSSIKFSCYINYILLLITVSMSMPKPSVSLQCLWVCLSHLFPSVKEPSDSIKHVEIRAAKLANGMGEMEGIPRARESTQATNSLIQET